MFFLCLSFSFFPFFCCLSFFCYRYFFYCFFISLLTLFHRLILQRGIFGTSTFFYSFLQISYNQVALCNSYYLNKRSFVLLMIHNYANTALKHGQSLSVIKGGRKLTKEVFQTKQFFPRSLKTRDYEKVPCSNSSCSRLIFCNQLIQYSKTLMSF